MQVKGHNKGQNAMLVNALQKILLFYLGLDYLFFFAQQ
jgi:hypothetical protein